MNIHTVLNGESLYDIARRYSVPVTKILQDNDLSTDRLTAGDELLILKPTKTVTIRGGDTLESLSAKYEIKKRALLCQNPSLILKSRFCPGQLITVKQDNSQIGIASAHAIIKRGCNREKLTRCIPYLTYLTSFAGVIRDNEVRLTHNSDWIDEIPYIREKVKLLGLYDVSGGKFLRDRSSYTKIIDGMISLAEIGKYSGIHISCKTAAKEMPNEFLEFLLETRKRFIGCDLILFTDVYEDTLYDSAELSDGAILNISDTSIKDIKEKMKKFSDQAESSKVFVTLSSTALISDKDIGIGEAKYLSYKCGKEIVTEPETLISSFDYTRYKNGIGNTEKITFPSLRYIKAKLNILSELGFMGVSFDTDSAPISYMTLFNSMFRRADFAL